MQPAAAFATVLLISTTLCSATFAREANWARDEVRRQEAAVAARALGLPPADRNRAQSPAPRIIGGVLSPPARWPFQAGLLLASVGDNFDAQFCGGTIIDEEFILTVAHCAELVTPSELHILTGTQSLASGGTRHTVKRIKIHPRYNADIFDFDVALVQLRNRIPNLRPVQAVNVITARQEKHWAAPGTKTFVTGWGSTASRFPNGLREVSVPIVDRDRCNAGRSYDGAVTSRMLCAGFRNTGGKDSCIGDSGGPLLVKNAAGHYRMQAGIVSWGTGCALPNFPGVYTRVAVFEAWISQTMEALRD